MPSDKKENSSLPLLAVRSFLLPFIISFSVFRNNNRDCKPLPQGDCLQHALFVNVAALYFSSSSGYDYKCCYRT